MLVLTGCGDPSVSPETDPVEKGQESASATPTQIPTGRQPKLDDLPQIKKRGKLVAITSYSDTSYFIYRGEPKGYDYELISMMAEDMGLELEIIIAKDMDAIFDMLNEGRADIIAYSMAVTKSRRSQVEFTEHHNVTHQVLVQRKPANWRDLKLHEIEKQLIRNQIDLIGKKVYVRKGSSYFTRLQNLSEEIGGDIGIIEMPGENTTEELVHKVANGDIDFTVSDESIALISTANYSILDVKTPVSFPQRIAWAVRKDSPKLRGAVDEWIRKARKEGLNAIVFNKYFQNRRAFVQRARSDYMMNKEGGNISEYDGALRKYAQTIGWDWPLLAAQAFHESRFDSGITSWAGAVGLMQLMPTTGEAYGATDLKDPDQNIKAATNYLKWLQEQWDEIEDETERTKFVLASYNVGKGHVDDACRLAGKMGYDPKKWDDNVEKCLRMLSKRRFFNDPVVKYGYCRGDEPVRYVRDVLSLHKHYKNFINSNPQPL